MKTFILVLSMYFPIAGNAQNVFVIEKEIPTKEVPVVALIINVTEDFDEVIDNYKKYVKESYDLKVKKENSSTYEVEAVDLPHLSQKRGDLRTYLIPTDSMNLLAFAFVLGYDIFLNSQDYPDQMVEFRKFTVSFMEYHYQSYYSKRIEMINKELDGLKKDLAKSENKINSLSKKVKSLYKKASKEEDESKKGEINSERQSKENEKNVIVNQLPEMRYDVIDRENELSELEKERNLYHQLITSL